MTTILTKSEMPEVSADLYEKARFISSYIDWLFSSGATCVRLEKNTRRIASALGLEMDMSILPRHIHLTLSRGSEMFTSVISIKSRPIDYDVITSLSRLSWNLADKTVSYSGAREEFIKITGTSHIIKWSAAVLPSLANAAFCRLFGGDWVAMGIVLIATMAGMLLKFILMERKVDFRLTAAVCAFVSTVLAGADGLFSLGLTPHIAIGTSVLYLVPGIPLINSFCDMIDCHYICAFGRMMNAVVITCCLSAGLCAGMYVMNVGMF